MASENDDNPTKVIRFQNENNSGISRGKYQATAKYDRKALKRRLEVEEWMHDQLKHLYDCKEEEDCSVDIDIDILLQEVNASLRRKMLEDLLTESKDTSEAFITELLKKVQALETNNKHTVTDEIAI